MLNNDFCFTAIYSLEHEWKRIINCNIYTKILYTFLKKMLKVTKISSILTGENYEVFFFNLNTSGKLFSHFKNEYFH